MSTYTDIRNKIKENITVDYKNRATPQEVHLLNPDNIYWGTFKGSIQADSISVTGCNLSANILVDSVLSDGTYILDEHGNKIDLMTLGYEVGAMSADVIGCVNEVERLSTEVGGYSSKINSATSQISDLTDDVINLDNKLNHSTLELNYNLNKERQERISSDDQLYIDLSKKINEVDASIISSSTGLSAAFSAKILEERTDRIAAVAEEENARISADNKLCVELFNALNTEKNARISADNTLSNALEMEAQIRDEHDLDLQTQIDTECIDRLSADNALHDEIVADRAASIEADRNLLNKINAVELASNEADASLQEQITTEVQTRIEQVQTVSTDLSINLTNDIITQTELNKHYALHNVNPYAAQHQIKDFCVNKLEVITDGYSFMYGGRVIAKVYDLHPVNSDIDTCTTASLQILMDTGTSPIELFAGNYEHMVINDPIGTATHKYPNFRLYLDRSSVDNKLQLRITGTPTTYYNYYIDGTSDQNIDAVWFDQTNKLTIKNRAELSGFTHDETFDFSYTDLISTEVDGKVNYIRKDSEQFILSTNYQISDYYDLIDTIHPTKRFGVIFKDDLVEQDGQIKSILVKQLSVAAEGDFVLTGDYLLNESNGFVCKVQHTDNYAIVYEDGKIKAQHINHLYWYNVRNTDGIQIPEVEICPKLINRTLDQGGEYFEVTVRLIDKVGPLTAISGDYVLSEYEEFKKVIAVPDSTISVEIQYNKQTQVLTKQLIIGNHDPDKPHYHLLPETLYVMTNTARLSELTYSSDLAVSDPLSSIRLTRDTACDSIHTLIKNPIEHSVEGGSSFGPFDDIVLGTTEIRLIMPENQDILSEGLILIKAYSNAPTAKLLFTAAGSSMIEIQYNNKNVASSGITIPTNVYNCFKFNEVDTDYGTGQLFEVFNYSVKDLYEKIDIQDNSISGNWEFVKVLKLKSDLSVEGNVVVDNNITTKSLEITNDLSSNGYSTLSTTTFTGEVTAKKDVIVQSNISVQNNANVDGTFSVGKDTTLSGSVYINGVEACVTDNYVISSDECLTTKKYVDNEDTKLWGSLNALRDTYNKTLISTDTQIGPSDTVHKLISEIGEPDQWEVSHDTIQEIPDSLMIRDEVTNTIYKLTVRNGSIVLRTRSKIVVE